MTTMKNNTQRVTPTMGPYEQINSDLLIADADFDKLCRAQYNITEESKYNYCPECKAPMEMLCNEYLCKYCGFIRSNDLDTSKISSGAACGTLRTSSGACYYFNGEYPKTQRRMILDELIRHQRLYTGPAIPPCAIVATADQYNLIQRDVLEEVYDPESNEHKLKKFVHRGNIKNEILATILYYECIRVGCIRHADEIARFMNLTIEGFARGENIVRPLVEAGNIDLPVDVEPIKEYAERYMSTLSLVDDGGKYLNFIVDIVKISEKHRLGMSSRLSSKVVGAMWIIIQQCGLKFTCKALESATGNTKKNTFNKFVKIVHTNPRVFADVFKRYGIPQPAT